MGWNKTRTVTFIELMLLKIIRITIYKIISHIINELFFFKKYEKEKTATIKRIAGQTSATAHRIETSETRFENKLGHVLIGSHCDCN